MTQIGYNERCPKCRKKKDVLYISDDIRMCKDCADFWGFKFCDLCQEYWDKAAVEFTDLPDGRHACEYCASLIGSEYEPLGWKT